MFSSSLSRMALRGRANTAVVSEINHRFDVWRYVDERHDGYHQHSASISVEALMHFFSFLSTLLRVFVACLTHRLENKFRTHALNQ